MQEDDLHQLRKLFKYYSRPQTNSNDHGYDGNPGEGSEEVRELPDGSPGVRTSIDVPLELSWLRSGHQLPSDGTFLRIYHVRLGGGSFDSGIGVRLIQGYVVPDIAVVGFI